jgi:hypothetical protein
MSSHALQGWLTVRKQALDEIENAHRKVGGPRRGRRHATRQLNYAYAVLLSAQFQGFCRELHDECVRLLVQWITPIGLRAPFGKALLQARKLDTGNPNPGNLGADFGRFGLEFWNEVNQLDVRNPGRCNELLELTQWRNAIAHQDPDFLAQETLHFDDVRAWRRVCENLAFCFDEVMQSHIESITGASPS